MTRTARHPQPLPFGDRELGYVRNAAAYPDEPVVPEVLKTALLGLFIGGQWTLDNASWRLCDVFLRESLQRLVEQVISSAPAGTLYDRAARHVPMGPRLGGAFLELSDRVRDVEKVDLDILAKHLDVFFHEPEMKSRLGDEPR
ncbi:MAG: hypothetical protein ACKVPX_11050 [Myxococcaceae bacterium]